MASGVPYYSTETSVIVIGLPLGSLHSANFGNWTCESRLTSVGLGGIALPTSNYTLFESEEAF